MSATWSVEEEAECREFLSSLDGKIKEKNEETKSLYHSLHISYILLRNVTFLTFFISALLQFFGAHLSTSLGLQSVGLVILMFLFTRFEFSGLNGKWFRGMRERSALINLRETVATDLAAGSDRRVPPWKEYLAQVRSTVL